MDSEANATPGSASGTASAAPGPATGGAVAAPPTGAPLPAKTSSVNVAAAVKAVERVSKRPAEQPAATIADGSSDAGDKNTAIIAELENSEDPDFDKLLAGASPKPTDEELARRVAARFAATRASAKTTKEA